MRRFFFTFFTVISLLLLCSCAYGDAALYRGTRSIGTVPIIDAKSLYYVPVDGVGGLLGFSSRMNGEEVILSRGRVSIRVIANSAAAWRGTSIVPLQSPAIFQNGRIWIDSASAVSLFQSSAGQGQANRLRFSKVNSTTPTTSTAASSSRSDVEFGRFSGQPQPAIPVQPQQSAPTPTPQPEPAQPIITAQAPQQEQAKTETPAPTVQEAPEEQPEPEPAQAVQKASKKKSGSPIAKAAAVYKKDTATRTVTNRKSQPRHETFKPTDSKKPTSVSWSGTIQSIRWTEQESTNRRIRAVIVADDDADPQVYMLDGSLHALFASSLENASALKSPYSDVTADLKKNSDGMELVFTSSGMIRAEKTVLTSPKRIVFDFFFPQEADEPKETQPAPEPQPEPEPAKPVAQTPEEPKRAEPIIIINNTNNTENNNDYVQEDPVITAAPKRTRDRKVIVVDPGHGGKDPGASANGVTEKNVNLGIGLELDRVLTAQGYNVIMTRRTDVYLQLQERTDIANAAEADLFVSIHVNALPSKTSLTGFEIYIMALPTDKDAMDLAKIENREYVEGKGYDTENVDRRTELLLRILGDMQQNNKISESTDFAAALYNAGSRGNLPMRRVAQAPFFVLRGAGMPAVLIETGFVTNAEEAHKLTTPEYQNQIARAMAAGIISYLK